MSLNRRDFLTRFSQEILENATQALDESRASASSRHAKRPVSVPTMPSAGAPDQYQPGDMVLVEDALAWLGRDDLGFYAMDAVCPHLGCLVRHVGGHFLCLCHGSRFLANGAYVEGPAPHGMRYLDVSLDKTGKLIIRRDKTVTAQDRLTV